MGQSLEKPAIDKHFDSGSGNNLKFAACGMQGWRINMEDSHTAVTSMGGAGFENVSFYAVFDGHAGAYTSKIASQELCQHFKDLLASRSISKIPDSIDSEEMEQFKQAISDSFVTFDDQLKNSEPYKSLREACGSTALVALVTANYVIFCNCGDSRGFLSRGGKVEFATQDHKPSDPLEKARIEKSGGCVIMDRVNGNLAVSRALGDFSFKDKFDLSTKDQAVSPEPTVTAISRAPELDQFMILACDGIWDVMTCEEVRKFFNTKLLLTDNLKSMCADLIDTCFMKDSRDNMTVLVVTFPGSPKVDSVQQEQDAKYEQNIKTHVKEIMQTQGNSIPLITVLNQLAECDLSPSPDCASAQLDIYSKKSFIEDLMNNIDPSRETDRDYSTMSNLANAPIALQAIQQLVRSEHGDNFGGVSIFDSAASDPSDNSNPTNSLDTPSNDVESDTSSTHEQ